jgi:hypothetical protein
VYTFIISFFLQDDSSSDNSSFDYDLYEKCIRDVSLFFMLISLKFCIFFF